jgi:hypothetical protein
VPLLNDAGTAVAAGPRRRLSPNTLRECLERLRAAEIGAALGLEAPELTWR